MRAMVLPKVVSLNETDSPLQLFDFPAPTRDPTTGVGLQRVPYGA